MGAGRTEEGSKSAASSSAQRAHVVASEVDMSKMNEFGEGGRDVVYLVEPKV